MLVDTSPSPLSQSNQSKDSSSNQYSTWWKLKKSEFSSVRFTYESPRFTSKLLLRFCVTIQKQI